MRNAADDKGPVFPLDAAAKIKPREEVSCCEKMSQGSNFFRIIVLFDLEVGTVVTLVLQSPGIFGPFGLAINEGQDMTAADKVLGYTAAVRLLSTNRVTRPIVCFQWTSHTFGLTAHPI